MSLVDFPTRRVIVEGARKEYVVASERIYGADPVTGTRTLLYPPGALVPLEEAVKTGLIEDAEPGDDSDPASSSPDAPAAATGEPAEGPDTPGQSGEGPSRPDSEPELEAKAVDSDGVEDKAVREPRAKKTRRKAG